MSLPKAGTKADALRLTEDDFALQFPEPEKPLLEGPGPRCSWAQCMRETAAQTRHWLKHFGDQEPPPPWEERFSLD